MRRGRNTRRGTAAFAVAATATATTFLATAAGAAVPVDTEPLRDAVTADAIMGHLAELQAIADANDGTRASGTPGYDASVDHIEALLQAAGYETYRQDFTFDLFHVESSTFARVSPDPRVFLEDDEYYVAEYSGEGDVTAAVEAVDLVLPPGPEPSTSNSGCEPEDFAGFTAGSIALVQRGTCDFSVKAANAYDAGAVGVILFNEGQVPVEPTDEDRTVTLNPTLGEAFADPIPVVGTSFAIGDELAAQAAAGTLVVRLQVDTEIFADVPTQNLIAETPTGKDHRTVMAGAHLDSVLEGPGINDNGTGSAALLEVALQMAALDVEPVNTVRFAWWGAEEAGLLGSQYYVDSLSHTDLNDVDLYLNFDMVGSPNYGRFVYDGDGSTFGTTGPNGSADIEGLFVDYFASQGLASEPTAFDGRSDYDAFVAAGIPSGGLFTGAEDAKAASQVALYGGLATFDGEPVAFDPCYHQACDSLDPVGDGADAALYAALNAAYGGALEYEGVISNVNQTGLEEMADAIAHAIASYALSTSSVKGTGNASAQAVESTDRMRDAA